MSIYEYGVKNICPCYSIREVTLKPCIPRIFSTLQKTSSSHAFKIIVRKLWCMHLDGRVTLVHADYEPHKQNPWNQFIEQGFIVFSKPFWLLISLISS
jgi:hypothetical protein